MSTLKALVLILLVTFTLNGFAKKDPVYPVSDIPEELKKNADAIVRLSSTKLSVISKSKAISENEMAITIMNENGNHFGEIELYFDKSSPINELQASIYDSNGKLIERVKNNDIEDYSASGSSLFTDNRVIYYEPVQKNYPYTIVYSYKQNSRGYLNFDEWSPYYGYRCAVQKSFFVVSVADKDNFRYKAYNMDLEPEIKAQNDKKVYTWQFEDLPALKKEPYSPSFRELIPKLLCAPREFQMDNVAGSMTSWKEFGNWRLKLNKDRDVLDAASQGKIKNLVKDCKSDYEKVKTLYEYLQNKTRYVSIQVGIGGWQAFQAQEVEDKAYGDCKALSNYMKALLKVVDIPSYYTIIEAGSNLPALDTSFVHNFSNHAILMVPLSQDTVWLECTSKNNPCGFMGSFTDDRKVLCMTENGGKLFHTPAYNMEDNTQITKARVTILTDGNARASVETNYCGIQYENIAYLYEESLEEQKKKLYKSIDLPDFKINSLSISQNKDRIPSSQLELDLDIRNYASKSGDRLFIPLNLLNRDNYIPKKIKERKTDIYKKREYCDTDSIYFTLPEGYEIESIPEKKVIETDFGQYVSEVIQKENQVTYIREVRYNKFRFPAERYDELRNYLKAKVRADKAKLILKVKELQ